MNNLILWACAGIFVLSGAVSWAGERAVARVAESGEVLELSWTVEGQPVVQQVPLHHRGGVRYFSAGVGLEERMAEYPPFPLKLVFTAGGKPFLAGVAVTITPAAGGPPVTIPDEQVDGPWLFVDVPSGVYDITGVHGGVTQRLKGIAVKAGTSKTVHLRWASDRGLSRPLPPRE